MHNNKQLLKELARANQTIGKLKGHLEKQTKVVVEQVKTAKQKKAAAVQNENKVVT